MVALTSRYQPTRIAEFAGLTRAKSVMRQLVESPFASAWLFTGDSGTGKTTLALAVAAEMGANVIHIPSSECSVERVRKLRTDCAQTPMFGDWHVVIVDEADQMTQSAQVAFLSLLDATGFPDSTVFIFTSNDTKKLEPRFLGRCKTLAFDGQVDKETAARYLYRIWFTEAGTEAKPPAFLAKLGANAGNIRAALNDMELELMYLDSAVAA
jgi:putative ATPase